MVNRTKEKKGSNEAYNGTYLTQICGAIVVCFTFLSLGASVGYPTQALRQLQSDKDEAIRLNENEASSFATVFWLTGIICAPVGGVLSGLFGRKKWLMLTAPVGACGWLLIGLAQNKIMLFFGYFIAASSYISQASSVLPFISETVHPSIRGNLVILTALFMATGKFFVWTVGYQVSWRMTAFILTIPPCLMTMLITFFHETPYWLIENTNYDGAKRSLQFYRGKDYDITEELNEINQKHQSKLQNSASLSMSYKVKRIFSMAFLKPFSCVGVIYSLTCWTGFVIFQTYMIDTLELSGGSKWMDIGLMPTIVGILGLVTAGIIPFFIGKFRPKVLFATTQCLSALSMLVFAAFNHFREYRQDLITSLDQYAWIPVAVIIVTVWCRTAGILPIIQSLQAESYPTEIRTESIGISQAQFLVSGAICIKFFPDLKNAIGLSNCCFLYGAVGLLNCVWGIVTIPDNRGKSLVKVEEMYEKKKGYENSVDTKDEEG